MGRLWNIAFDCIPEQERFRSFHPAAVLALACSLSTGGLKCPAHGNAVDCYIFKAFVQNCHIHVVFIIHVRQLENIFGRKEKTDG